MKIRSCALYGAGAVGSYFIWGLMKKPDIDFCIVAKDRRKEKLEKEGILINGIQHIPPVRTPEEAYGVDLLIVCLKYGALEESLDDIAAIVDDHTLVFCPMNGVDSEEVIGSRIGLEHMLYSVIKISSERKGNSSVFNAETTPGVFFGEKGISEPTDRTLAVSELFQDTGMHYFIMPDIMLEIWYKFALNVSQNLPQAIIGVGFGSYADSAHMNALRAGLRNEVTAVAAKKGYDISTPLGVEGKSSPTAKHGRYSTLQDLDAGRHTEIDAFAGAMVRMGKECGIPVPYCEFAYHCIKALEEKNDGLFDYE